MSRHLNNNADKLYFLEQYTRGEPHRGYHEAMHLLVGRYDNLQKIATALKEKVLATDKIRGRCGTEQFLTLPLGLL